MNFPSGGLRYSERKSSVRLKMLLKIPVPNVIKKKKKKKKKETASFSTIVKLNDLMGNLKSSTMGVGI